MERIDYSQLPECDLIVERINKRFRQGLGTNIYVIGLSGTGKSSASQRIAELIQESRENKPATYIVDSLIELLKSVRIARIGDVIIIEEVSVLFSSRRAMAGENVAVGKIFDTIRKKQLVLISNAPLWNGIDSHMRSMGHLIIETLRINKTQKVVVSKFHELQTNPSSGKTYRHTLRRDGRDVNRMFTKMPNLERWNEYEEEKDRFMDELYKSLLQKEKLKKDKEQNVKLKKLTLTEKELNIHNFVNVKGKSMKEAAKKFGVTIQRISAILINISKKGGFAKEK